MTDAEAIAAVAVAAQERSLTLADDVAAASACTHLLAATSTADADLFSFSSAIADPSIRHAIRSAAMADLAAGYRRVWAVLGATKVLKVPPPNNEYFFS
jgi:Na+/proline symporter